MADGDPFAPATTLKPYLYVRKCMLCGSEWNSDQAEVHTPPGRHSPADWEAYRVAHGLGEAYPRYAIVNPPEMPPESPAVLEAERIKRGG